MLGTFYIKVNRLENLITFSKIKDWEITEIPNKKVILHLRKRVPYSSSIYVFELPFEINNAVILSSSEDIHNQVIFTSTIDGNVIRVKRWPDVIAGGSNVVNICIIANKIIV